MGRDVVKCLLEAHMTKAKLCIEHMYPTHMDINLRPLV